MQKQAISIIDCAYGDGGKGTMIDSFARRTQAHLVVRANGGPQARHTVVTKDGRIHGYAQFGSASFVEGVETFLSRFMTVGPTQLVEEAECLSGLGVSRPFERLMIDRRSPIVTLYHRAANWLKELARGEYEHGTCGMGVGELMEDILNHQEDVIYAEDLQNMRTLVVKTRSLRNRKRSEVEDLVSKLSKSSSQRVCDALRVIEENEAMSNFLNNCKIVAQRVRIIDEGAVRELFAQSGTILFEGAQGVLLDEDYGFHPHTTWSHTTTRNVETLLDENGFDGTRKHIGVLRSYATRHGAGPFVTDVPEMKAAFPEPHNIDDGWQGNFRVGTFDFVAGRYATRVAGHLCGIALTHVDRIGRYPEFDVCVAYQYVGHEDVSRYFDCTGTTVTDIRVSRNEGDLTYQSEMTRHLRDCRPIVRRIGIEEFFDLIEREFYLQILATSHGQTAERKVFYPNSPTTVV
jgi:adenylosuccinate synthase